MGIIIADMGVQAHFIYTLFSLITLVANGHVKISNLGPGNVINAWGAPLSGGGSGQCYALLDEQEIAGDPAAGKGGNVTSDWMPGYQKWYYPPDGAIFALVDLKQTYDLTAIWAFHKWGVVNLTIAVGKTPFDLNPTTWGGPDSWLNKWAGWNLTKSVGNNVRYISISLHIPNGLIELVVYGTPAEPELQHGSNSSHTQGPLMSTFLGVNGFVDDPLERLKCTPTVREYHNWDWTEGNGDPGWPHAQNAFSPAWSPFDFDSYYNATHAVGLIVHQCLQRRAIYLTNGKDTEEDWKPAPDSTFGTAATEDPASYIGLSAHAFQVAARYGSVKVPDAVLQLKQGQPRLSGLGTLSGIEIQNEMNAWWEGRERFMTPYEQAAMTSAAYDGHCGKLGAGIGAKTADPNIKVIAGGLANDTLDIFETMRLWAASNRADGKFPADVINFHLYCTDGYVNHHSTRGLPPEECDMRGQLSKLTAWRNAKLSGVEIWLTEFGYDTNQQSPVAARMYGSFSAQQVQGMWIVRGLMAALASGFDRTHIYMLRNVNEQSSTQYASSGLTSSKASGWVPKFSWYAVSTVTNTIGHMRFQSETFDNATGIYISSFVSKNAPFAGYVVWSGTHKSQVINNFPLHCTGATASTNITLVELVMNSTTGKQSHLVASTTGVVILKEVGEMPQIILLGAKPTDITGPVPPIISHTKM